MNAYDDYACGGYFLSRFVGPYDCTGIELRRVTLANDHTPRVYLPDAWAIEWVTTDDANRVASAQRLGIDEAALPALIAQVTHAMDRTLGWQNVCYSLDAARELQQEFLPQVADLALWGIGLPRALRDRFLARHRPPPPKPGFAPTGAGGSFDLLDRAAAALAPGGCPLGHEILSYAPWGFESIESQHGDEALVLARHGVTANAHGLIDSLDEALACCESVAESGHHASADELWLPWLLVDYPL